MQKKKFTQTESFQTGVFIAQCLAFSGGVVLGMKLVETAVRKVLD